MGQFKSEIRDGMRIDWDVPIEMDDGVVLRSDVFRPIEEGKYPVIMNYGLYGKWLAFQDDRPEPWRRMIEEHPDVAAGSTNEYQHWEVVDPEKWVPDGYICMRIDSRGSGRSPGYFEPFSPRETKDLYNCIEWAARQPWSNGKVGLNGISYYAMNQWQVACLKPPHLAAICVWEGAADYYRDFGRHGGIFCTYIANWYENRATTKQHGRGERGYKSRMTGDWVSGPETLSDEALRTNRCDLGRDVFDELLGDLQGVAVGVVVDLEVVQAAVQVAPGDVGLVDEGLLDAVAEADAAFGHLGAAGVLEEPARPPALDADRRGAQFRYPRRCWSFWDRLSFRMAFCSI